MIKKVLAEKGRLRQYEVIKEVKKEAKKEDEKAEIGTNKIREALAKYDGVYWVAERGERNALEYELIVQVKVEEKDQDSRGAGCVNEFSVEVEPEEREPTEQEKKIIEELENYVLSCVANGRQGAGVEEAVEEVAKDLTKEFLSENEYRRLEDLRKKKRLEKNEKKEKEELEKKFSSLYEFHLSEVSRVLNLFLDKTKLKKDGIWLKINEEKEIEELANEYDF